MCKFKTFKVLRKPCYFNDAVLWCVVRENERLPAETEEAAGSRGLYLSLRGDLTVFFLTEHQILIRYPTAHIWKQTTKEEWYIWSLQREHIGTGNKEKAPCPLFLFKPCSAWGKTRLTVSRTFCRVVFSRGRMAGIKALAGDTTALKTERNMGLKTFILEKRKSLIGAAHLYRWAAGTILDMAHLKSLLVMTMEFTSRTSFWDEE